MQKLIYLLLLSTFISCVGNEVEESPISKKPKESKEKPNKEEILADGKIFFKENRPACTSKTAGEISFDRLTKELEFCDGDFYVSLNGEQGEARSPYNFIIQNISFDPLTNQLGFSVLNDGYLEANNLQISYTNLENGRNGPNRLVINNLNSNETREFNINLSRYFESFGGMNSFDLEVKVDALEYFRESNEVDNIAVVDVNFLIIDAKINSLDFTDEGLEIKYQMDTNFDPADYPEMTLPDEFGLECFVADRQFEFDQECTHHNMSIPFPVVNQELTMVLPADMFSGMYLPGHEGLDYFIELELDIDGVVDNDSSNNVMRYDREATVRDTDLAISQVTQNDGVVAITMINLGSMPAWDVTCAGYWENRIEVSYNNNDWDNLLIGRFSWDQGVVRTFYYDAVREQGFLPGEELTFTVRSCGYGLDSNFENNTVTVILE